MAGKTKPMSKIKQLLRLHEQGMAIKFIARSLEIARNTVREYLQKLKHSKRSISELLAMEDPELEAFFHLGNPAYKDLRYEHMKNLLAYLEKELERKGVTKRLLWTEYIQGYTGGYRYTQFCFHLKQLLIARKPSMVLTHKPGEKLFIDFAGKKLSYVNQATGEIVYCPVFVACLPYSDYSFVMAVHTQGIEDFMHALACCLREIGGVPHLLVPDNLKAAITKANNYEPEISRAMDDFANHYGTAVVPARAARPKDKALVENQVKLSYSRIFAKLRNQTFFSLHDLNRGISEKSREHNQTRMQQKPYCREERFLADEKQTLNPLPETDFVIKYYRKLKVAKNNSIYLAQDKHFYSVHYSHIGSIVNVIYDRNQVRIYSRGSQIATHIRNYQQGGYTFVKEHLCSHHQHYLSRSPAYYTKMAAKVCEPLGRFVSQMFETAEHPEKLYKTCDGLMALHRKTPGSEFNKAIDIALENEQYSYRFVKELIENKMTDHQESSPQPALPMHKNIRGKQYYSYQQHKITF